MVAESEAHPDDALRLYGQAVDLRPDALEPLEAQTRLLTARKGVPEALKRLDELSVRFPETALPLQIKGDLLLSKDRVAEAGEAFKAASARTPKWWLPYRQLARVQLRSNEPDAALATLKAGLPVTSQRICSAATWRPCSRNSASRMRRLANTTKCSSSSLSRTWLRTIWRCCSPLIAKTPQASIVPNNSACASQIPATRPFSILRLGAL